MQRRSLNDSTCPVARSLDSIGDWWTLLIVRDAMLGVRRFSDFQRSLGLARNVLSARLKKMVADGVMTMAPSTDGTSYQEYQLTKKGEALLPVLVAMRQWGERFFVRARRGAFKPVCWGFGQGTRADTSQGC